MTNQQAEKGCGKKKMKNEQIDPKYFEYETIELKPMCCGVLWWVSHNPELSAEKDYYECEKCKKRFYWQEGK